MIAKTNKMVTITETVKMFNFNKNDANNYNQHTYNHF